VCAGKMGWGMWGGARVRPVKAKCACARGKVGRVCGQGRQVVCVGAAGV